MREMFLSVLTISVSVSLVIPVLVLLGPLLNRRYAAKWKYWIWIALAVRLVIPYNGNGMNRRITVEIPVQMTTPVASDMGEAIILPPQMEKSHTGMAFLDIAAVIWLAGSMVFLAVHLFSYVHFRRQLYRKGTPVRDKAILCQLSELKQELHIRQRISAVAVSETVSPMVIGFCRKILVLPEEHYSEEQLHFILKHEMVHVKRHDICFKLLFVLANAVHWFNPVIWMMQKEAAVDMELSCDERVIQGMDHAGRKAYTETLFYTFHRQCVKKTKLSTQFYGGKQIMKKRFQNILKGTRKKNGLFLLVCAMLLAIVPGMLTGCSVTEAPSPVTFDPAEEADKGRIALTEPAAPVNDDSAVSSSMDNTTLQENGVYYVFTAGADENDMSVSFVTDGSIQIVVVRKYGYTAIGPFSDPETLTDDVTEQCEFMNEYITEEEKEMVIDAAKKITGI